MTENDIKGNLLALRELVANAAGSELPPDEQRFIKAIVETSLLLLEGLLVDINRSSDALNFIAGSLANMPPAN